MRLSVTALFRREGSLIAAGGFALVVVGLVGVVPTAVATVCVVGGGAAFVLGVLLPRLEGVLKLGPMEATLRHRAVEVIARQTEADGMDPAERDQLIRKVDEVLQRVEDAEPLAHRLLIDRVQLNS